MWQAGFEHVLFCELDSDRRAVLADRWPGVPIEADVHLVSGVGLHVDAVCGGFPCQDVSVANVARAGLGGAKSGLWWQFYRVVCEARPQWVLIENVPGLLTARGGRDFGTVVDALADIGYGVAWRVLDARTFGVAQRRDRLFVVGRAGDRARSAANVLGLADGCAGSVVAGREARPADAGAVADGVAARDGTGPVAWVKAKRASSVTDFDRWEQAAVAPTLTSTDNTSERRATVLVVQDGMPRLLTPVEHERLMGWPDGWTRAARPAKRVSSCGVGVVAPVACWLGARMRAEHTATTA